MPRFALTAVATAAITWASLTSMFPEMPIVQQVPFYDKWAHFLMYGALSLIVQWDCRHSSFAWRRPDVQRGEKTAVALRRMACFFLFPSFWGIMMELAQDTLTTWRTGDPVDALANTVGAALGTLAGIVYNRVGTPR